MVFHKQGIGWQNKTKESKYNSGNRNLKKKFITGTQ